MINSVDNLLYNDFSRQPLKSQKLILLLGKPRPLLPNFHVRVKVQLRPIAFDSMLLYDHNDWLTACPKRNRLFCWPCLLMGRNTDGWNDWNMQGQRTPLSQTQLKSHENTEKHIRAELRLKMFKDKHLPRAPTQTGTTASLVLEAHEIYRCPPMLGSGAKESMNRSLLAGAPARIVAPLRLPSLWQDDLLHNSIAQRNRTLLGRVTDAVVVLMLQKSRFRQRNVDPLTVEQCVEMVCFPLTTHGVLVEDPSITEDATFLLRNSPSFLRNVVDAISSVLKASIKKEANGSAFMSIILNGHHRTDKTNILRSAVLRYLKNGKVCERFVGFYREDYFNCSSFYLNLARLVSEFKLAQRVVSLAVDGLCPFKISSTLSLDIVSLYPYMMFVPCYFHQYWDGLVQILSCNELINTNDPSTMCTFFEMTESMGAFLKDHRDDVEAYIRVKISLLDQCDSTKNLLFLNWVRIHRKELIEYFDQTSRASDKWKEEDLTRIGAFGKFLVKFSAVFWLLFFIRLFTLTKQVNKVLCSQNPETLLVTGMLETVLSKVVAECQNFEQFWNSVINYLGTEVDIEVLQEKNSYRDSYHKVLTCLTQQTSNRMGHLRSVAFFKLLNPSNFYPTLPDVTPLLLSLCESYGPGFNFADIVREIRDLYVDNRALLGYSIEQLLEYMTRYESRRKRLPNMIKLAQLVLAMPCIKPSDARPPVIHKVKAIVPSPDLPESPDCSVLYVESELLEDMHSSLTFHDEVIDMFGRISKDKVLLHFQR